MKVISLGTNGFFPSFGRQTACYAIPYNKTLIVLDAGSGLFRFAETIGQRLLKEAEEIHLFLSHYHLDHTFGFYAAFKLFEGKKVTVFAPTDKKVFSDLAREYFPIDYEKTHKNFMWQKLKIGENKTEKYSVGVRKQDHRGEGSLAFRFSFDLAYITDSEYSKEGIEFVRGVKLLLHEHYLTGSEKVYFDGKHVTTVGAATIAKEANVRKLALIHHYPFADDKQLESQLKLAMTIFPNTILAKDLEEMVY